MSLSRYNNFPENLTPDKLCRLIRFEYQPEILNLCANINKYFNSHPYIAEISVDASELTHLLFGKLHNELTYLFLQETGIVFPCIIQNYKQHKNYLGSAVCQTIHQKQAVIISLIEKIKMQLHQFTINPQWNKELKKCIARLFILEIKVLEWAYLEQKFLYPKVTIQNKTYLHAVNNFSIFSLN